MRVPGQLCSEPSPVRASDTVPSAPRPDSAQEHLAAFEHLSDVATRIAGSVDLQPTLEAVAAAVVDSLGFGAAVLNLVRGDRLHVVAVSGSEAVKAALLGTSDRLAVWNDLLAHSIPLGGLRFIDGRSSDALDGLFVWVPDIPVSPNEDRWHPHDALFAPLHARSGELLGVLSVDLPRDGQRPESSTVALLERFAVMAELAIERASMYKIVADSAELFRRTFEDAPLGMALLAPDGRVEQLNTTYARIVDRKDEELTGHYCWDLVHVDDRARVRAAVEAVITGALPLSEGDVRDGSGERWGRATISSIHGPDGPKLLVQMLDVTDQRRATTALRSQATTDVLTGLANRSGLAKHLEALLARPRSARNGQVAAIFCDLDLFKLVNDTHGHAAGDELLVHAATALRGEMRGGDLAARFGGDEFVVILDGCDGPAGAVAAAERMRAAINQPIRLAGGVVTPSVSLGIALAELGHTPEQLLADADTALYRAKDAGRGRWVLFAPDMRDEALARLRLRLRLREQLRHAVAEEQFLLHYQPLVELATGRIHGYEALLRWQHPERGLLLPGEFLSELMQGDLAAPVTDWIVEQALAEAATWPEEDGIRPYISVNVTPEQLSRTHLQELIRTSLRQHRVDPTRLWIEITEQAVVTGSVQFATLEALRRDGVHVALDDFGSGYAGLLALRDIPADVIKLDRAFTQTLLSDNTTLAIVESVIALCTKLNRLLVAEGLEKAEDVAALRAMGVPLGQGWYLGRPGPLAG